MFVPTQAIAAIPSVHDYLRGHPRLPDPGCGQKVCGEKHANMQVLLHMLS